ncbi:MAG: SDR family NAD(P)-dependent oxidoreductase [Burkholderiaceae bacterium]
MAEKALTVVTGASSGIGFELARCAARAGHDLIVVASSEKIEDCRSLAGEHSVGVETVRADLSSGLGVNALLAALGDRPVDNLIANAGVGLGGRFVQQSESDIEHLLALNVQFTTGLVHEFARRMQSRRRGRILLTGSIVGWIPGANHAVYNASKAYVDILAWGIRHELLEYGVSVTCLMPGATDTGFFGRGGLGDTLVGQVAKDDPATVARAGFNAMMAGDSGVTPGVANRIQSFLANVLPDTVMAKIHARVAARAP